MDKVAMLQLNPLVIQHKLVMVVKVLTHRHKATANNNLKLTVMIQQVGNLVIV